MKKFLAFVMVCVLLVSLAACRNTEENPTNGTTAPIGSETQNNSNETQDTKEISLYRSFSREIAVAA